MPASHPLLRRALTALLFTLLLAGCGGGGSGGGADASLGSVVGQRNASYALRTLAWAVERTQSAFGRLLGRTHQGTPDLGNNGSVERRWTLRRGAFVSEAG